MSQTNLKVVRVIHELFKTKDLKLSVAESCTGGLICHLLTELPGASGFFCSGIIAYSGESKMKILGVSEKTISTYGLVSSETAIEMAVRMRILSNVDYAVSTTGNLGPDVLEGKEKGLIYIAVSSRENAVSKDLRLHGDREDIKMKAAVSALEFLVKNITG